ncbi:hypothetical protein MF271_08010 [Deinococcus sp. KNUC1210]|nr:hypothetical protein [Deinococcus sp. KNUC1210]ULH16508.1 hypothetical protein MF271_08010 [Deinococcus sp. KNUC1210]
MLSVAGSAAIHAPAAVSGYSVRMFQRGAAPTRLRLGVVAGVLALVLLSRGFSFDQAAVDWAHTRRSYALDFAAMLITNLGSPLVVLLLTLAGSAALLVFRRGRLAAFLLLNVLLVSGLNEGVKQLVQRPVVQISASSGPAPPQPTVLHHPVIINTPALPRTVYAFPSGHTAGSAAMLLALSLLGGPGSGVGGCGRDAGCWPFWSASAGSTWAHTCHRMCWAAGRWPGRASVPFACGGRPPERSALVPRRAVPACAKLRSACAEGA